MSPKRHTTQPTRTAPTRRPEDVEAAPEALFWVEVTVPANGEGLAVGDDLLLDVSGEQVSVLRSPALLVGVLERAGTEWVRAHGHSRCVFERYGAVPSERLRVRITGGI